MSLRLRPAIGIAVLGLALGAVSLGYPRTPHDHSVYAYIAFTMLDGGVLYRDAWDVKGPGIFLWNALSTLFGRGAVAMHMFDILWQILTALALGALAWRIYRHHLARLFAALAWLIYYFSQSPWNWAHPESLSVLPLTVALLILLGATHSDRSVLWLSSGLCIGIAILIKLPFGLMGVIPLIAAARASPASAKRIMQRFAVLAAGAATPMVLWISYAAVTGALDGYLQSQFVYAVRYTNYNRSFAEWQEVVGRLARAEHVWLYGWGALTAIVLGVLGPRRRGMKDAEWMLPAWLAIAVIVAVLHGTVAAQHLQTFAPPVFLLTAGLFSPNSALLHSWQRTITTFLLLAAALLLIAPARILVRHATVTWKALILRQRPVPFADVALYLRQRTHPEETIYVLGSPVSIYLLADRKSASPILGPYPLLPPWKDLPFRRMLMQDLRANRPSYVVVFAGMLGSRSHRGTESGSEAGGHLADFSEFPDWLTADYDLTLDAASHRVYRRKPSVP